MNDGRMQRREKEKEGKGRKDTGMEKNKGK